MAGYENIKNKGFDHRTTDELRIITSKGVMAKAMAFLTCKNLTYSVESRQNKHMWRYKDKMGNIIAAINIILGIIITSSSYSEVGIVFGTFAIVLTFVLYNTVLGTRVVKSQMKNLKDNMSIMSETNKKILVSVACLSIAVQIGAAITLFVTTGATIMFAFALLLACGYFFEGTKSGMTIWGSYGIAKLVIKLFCFLQVTLDRIAEWLAKLELSLFDIEK